MPFRTLGLTFAALALSACLSCRTRDETTTRERSGVSAYEATMAGTRCYQNKTGMLECDYKVGGSLHFTIAGVGEPDAGIYFYRSTEEGDYVVSFALHHGCVIVRSGAGLERFADLAFVSPRNGAVYRNWEKCRDATPRTASAAG